MQGDLHCDTFDWVKERASCSLGIVFEKLKLELEEDVKTRNALRPENAPYSFATLQNGDKFLVLLNSNQVRRAVKFVLGTTVISVLDNENEPMFEATLTLNDTGQCRAKIKGEEREFWQLRRSALEDLFFGFYS